MKKIFGFIALIALSSSMQVQAAETYGFLTDTGSSGQYQVETVKSGKSREVLRQSLCEMAKQDANEKLEESCRRQFGNNGENGITSENEMVGDCQLKEATPNHYSAQMEVTAKCSKE